MAVEAKLGEAFVEIRARLDKFQQDLNQIKANTQAAGRASEQAFAQATASANRFGTALKTLGGIASVEVARRFLAMGDDISDTAKMLGVGAEKLQEWQAAGTLAGASSEQVTNAISKFGRELGNTSVEVTQFQIALGRLGLQQAELKKLGLEGALQAVSDRLSQITDVTQRNNIAFELFGRTGIKAVNFLSAGSAEMKKFGDEARRAGIIISADIIEKADRATDVFGLMGLALRAAGVNISVGLLPGLIELNKALSSQEFQSGVRTFAGSFLDAVKWMVDNKSAIMAIAGALAGLAILGRFGPTGAVAGTVIGGAIGLGLANKEGRPEQPGNFAQRFSSGTEDAAVNDLKAQLDAIDAEIAANRNAVLALERLNKSATDNQTNRNNLLMREKELLEQRKAIVAQMPDIAAKTTVNGNLPEFFPQIAKAIDDLLLKRKVLANEFKDFAEGFPDILKSLNIQGVDVNKMLAGGAGNLKGQFAELNVEVAKYQAEVLRNDIASPWQKLNEQLDKANTLLKMGVITQEEFNARALQLKMPGLTNMVNDLQGLRVLDSGLVSGLNQISTAFGDIATGAKTGSEALQGLKTAFIRTLAEMAAKMLITLPIAMALKSALGFALGGTGGGVESFGLAMKMHGGGRVGVDGQPIIVPAGTFNNAKRYHGGGPILRSGEVPIIAEEGEYMVRKGGMRGGGGGSTKVEIYSLPGTTFDQQTKRSGGQDTTVLVQREVSRQLGGGYQDRSMGRFNVTPPMRSR